jgi:hypothetical protein
MSQLLKQKLLAAVQSQIQIQIPRAVHLVTVVAVVVAAVAASQMVQRALRMRMDLSIQKIHQRIQKRQLMPMAQHIADVVVAAQPVMALRQVRSLMKTA